MVKKIFFSIFGIITLIFSSSLKAEQKNIARVDLMPGFPQPYSMRNWEKVAQDYDSFVFNFDLEGDYLPLVSWDERKLNFERDSFYLSSYVGSGGNKDEAINCLAAVVGATLVGIDKTTQPGGYNWVEMCENWFSQDLQVYVNKKSNTSTGSFWYTVLPNILFYQLAYFYPDEGDFQSEMRIIADKFYEACVTMGGEQNPWQNPNFNHQGFNFGNMTVVDGGWSEPDAAGGIAWIEYLAYLKFREPKYLTAAHWGIGYLDSIGFNPSYEILLPYGAYICARMNAELGTNYNLDKIINWCFESSYVRGGWGIIAQQWGDYDCYGLHGSITDGGGYAFAMGTFETIGCLVPLVRYNDSYARAIGKYVLNAANASGLFYGDGLDPSHQDSYNWIEEYDKNYCIAYEGLRKCKKIEDRFDCNYSPFATGDAIGWGGPTNLGLYGSSHIGILGAIISTTNVEGILQLDCLKTDYYHQDAYPTYLYYNPNSGTEEIEINFGTEPKDLYDAVNDTFVVCNVSGQSSFPLEGNSAILLVVLPADGEITYSGNKVICNGIIIDYNYQENGENGDIITIFSDNFEEHSVGDSPDGWTIESGTWNVQSLGGNGKQYHHDGTAQVDQRTFVDRDDLWRGLSFKTKVYVDARSGNSYDKTEMLIFYRNSSNYVRLQMFYDKIRIGEVINGNDKEQGFWFYDGHGSAGGSGNPWTWGIDNWYELRADLTVYTTSTTIKFGIYQDGNKKSECTGTVGKYTNGKFGLSCWGEKTYFDDIEVQGKKRMSFRMQPLIYDWGTVKIGEKIINSQPIILTNDGDINLSFSLSCIPQNFSLLETSSPVLGNEVRILAIFNSSCPVENDFSNADYLTELMRRADNDIFAGDQSGIGVLPNETRNLWFLLETPATAQGLITDTEFVQLIINAETDE